MKRRFRAAVLLLVLTVLLTTVVFADSIFWTREPTRARMKRMRRGWTRRCCRRFVRRFLQDGTAAFRRAQPERPSGETLPGRQAKTARCFIRSAMSACRRRTGF